MSDPCAVKMSYVTVFYPGGRVCTLSAPENWVHTFNYAVMIDQADGAVLSIPRAWCVVETGRKILVSDLTRFEPQPEKK